MVEQILNVFEVNTDAIATNKGFYYQYLTILKKWIVNFIEDSNIDAFTEVDQDIKEVGENLLFTQVKCYTSNFNLNSEEVRSTIFDFFLLYLKNKDSIENLSFCFSTNTSVSVREKILPKWINDPILNDSILKSICIAKINEILNKEIKSKKNKKLNKRISNEQRQEIKLSSENLIQLVNETKEDFTLRIKWKFENLPPDLAITNLKDEIYSLLKNEKFENKPIQLLFGVLISEIYKRSQNKNSEERCLTKQVLIDLLNHSEKELESYLNIKFFKLINIEFELLRIEIQNIRAKVDHQNLKIKSLEDKIDLPQILPKDLNLIPEYNFFPVYGWDEFLILINSKLKDEKLVSIFSEGGMGKTSFAKKYLKTFLNYDHIIWITVEKSIPYSFAFDEVLMRNLNIETSCEKDIEEQFKIILSKLNNVEGENLIIVDIQELEDDLNSFNLLISLSNWQKMILTRNHLKAIMPIKLPQIDIENAKKVFSLHCSNEEVDEKVLVEFIEFIDYNILVIELVAKTMENSLDLTLEQFLKSLKEQNLDDQEYGIDIELIGGNGSIKIFNYLLKRFSLPNLGSAERNYIEFLALLPTTDIIIEDIILINGPWNYAENKVHIANMLNALAKKGLVQFSADKKSISIHKIIKEIILYSAREEQSPFFGSFFYISWLTARIREGKNNPSVAYKYLRYAQSILDNIKEKYRLSIYQPLIMLENELMYSYRFFINPENQLPMWINLAERAEKCSLLDEASLGAIYCNAGLAYAETDTEKAIEQFLKSLRLFNKNQEVCKDQIIIVMNNISNVYLKAREIELALENFGKIIKFRKKYNLFDDQQLVIEYKIIAESYKICGDIKKATEFMEEGIKLHYTLDKEKRNDFFLSACYNYLSQLYLLDNNLDLAILSQENALKILEEMNLESSEYLLDVCGILKHLYKYKGDSEKEAIINSKINSFTKVSI